MTICDKGDGMKSTNEDPADEWVERGWTKHKHKYGPHYYYTRPPSDETKRLIEVERRAVQKSSRLNKHARISTKGVLRYLWRLLNA